MSVGTWNPEPTPAEQPASIDMEFLRDCIELMPPEPAAIELSAALTEQQQADNAHLMRLGPEAWNATASTLNAEDVFTLMCFFTLAEMQLSGWEGEDKSPVIWLNKILKQRGEALDREQVLWIKQNTRNRFLPNGAIL